MRRQHPDTLTAREREVLNLIRHGLTNEQIAQRLGISVDGAKYHVSQILSKLGVATREEAAGWRPEEGGRWFWKVGWIGAAGALAGIAALALVLSMSGGGDTVQLESEVLARRSDDRDTKPRSVASRLTTTPVEQPLPTAVAPLLGADQDSDPEPDPSHEPSNEPPNEPPTVITPQPTPSPGPPETPRPTDCACTGIDVRVTESPVCAGFPQGPECAPRPRQATIAVWNADGTIKLLEFTTDAQGHFRVPLAQGQYYVDPEGPMSPSGLYFVTVPASGFVILSIDYDTGIR